MRYCAISGEPEGVADPALVAVHPPVERSPSEEVREYARSQGLTTFDEAKSNLYFSVWRGGGITGVTPTSSVSSAVVGYVGWVLETAPEPLRSALGAQLGDIDQERGLFLLNVDWFDDRWRPLASGDVREAALGAGRVLAAMAASNFIHGWITPTALRTCKQTGETRICRWPLSALVATSRARLVPGIGEILGDPRYVAPEAAFGEPIKYFSDLYSLGASLLEISGLSSAHSARGPLLGPEWVSRRAALFAEDWVAPGKAVTPLLLGCVEPDPTLRSFALGRWNGTDWILQKSRKT